MKGLAWIPFFVSLLSGCGGGDSRGMTSPPALTLNCHSKSKSCAQDSAPVFAALDRNFTESCDHLFMGHSLSELRHGGFSAWAVGQASSSGGFLQASLPQWLDESGCPVSIVDYGHYRVCAFIDTNGNGRLDPGEPVAEARSHPGQAQIHLSEWHPASD